MAYSSYAPPEAGRWRGIKYVSWGGSAGYAVAARSYLRALAGSGLAITWCPMVDGWSLGLGTEPHEARGWPDADLAPLCNRPLDYDVVLLHTTPEYYPYWLERERAPGRRFYGYTVYELDRIPPRWPQILNRLDGVLVPCRWNVETFRAAGVTVPLHVVPHLRPHEGERGPSEADRAALLGRLGGPDALRGRLVFYTIGMWTNRKSMDRTVRAFLRAFTDDDPVALVIKTGPDDFTTFRRSLRHGFLRRAAPARETVAALLAEHPRPPMVRVIDDDRLPDGEIRALHDLGDVFVSLARAEGVGLGAFEAAARGKPVVMTRYGGALEFLPPERSWLVDHRMVAAEDPARWMVFANGETWPEASIDDAARALREIAADPAAAKARAAPLAEYVAERFAEGPIVSAFRTVLDAEPPAAPAPSARRIPNQFLFVFGLRERPEPLHLMHYLCLESCLRVNRPDRVYFCCHHEPYGRYWELIRRRLVIVPVSPVALIDGLAYRDRHVRRFRYAHHADVVRLQKLQELGGAYADLDTLFVNPLPARLFEQSTVLGREPDVPLPGTGELRPSLCNAVILAEREAPFVRRWLEELPGALDGTWSNHSTLLPQRLGEQYPSWLHVEPQRTFYRYAWNRADLRRLFEGCERDQEGVASIHLWAHLWWSRWRRDFSGFHAGLLTEDHVRSVDTTYTLLARPFLPATARPWTGWRAADGASHVAGAASRTAARAAHTARGLAALAAGHAARALRRPTADERLARARLDWAFRGLPVRGPLERQAYEDVVRRDVFGLSREPLRAEDVVLDVGLCSGLVGRLCHLRGSRTVRCYEPDGRRYPRLAAFVEPLEGVRAYPFGPAATPGDPAWPPLDELLAPYPEIRLLRLDLPGRLREVLMASACLGRVRRLLAPWRDFDRDLGLHAALTEAGLEVRLDLAASGWLDARRPGACRA